MKKTSIILLCLFLASLILLGGCANKQTTEECKRECVDTMNKVFENERISTTQLKTISDNLNDCLEKCKK